MKVSSPIGELPFTPRRLRFRNRALELEGLMGAWPARVEIGLSELPSLMRVAGWVVAIALVLVVVIVAVVVTLILTIWH